KRDPEKRDNPVHDCTRRDTIKPNRRKYDQHDPGVEEGVDMQGIDEMVDVKDATAHVENFQDESEEWNTAEHHVRKIAEQRRNKETHPCSVFAHFFLGPRFNPALERRGGFRIVKNYKWSLVYFPIFLLLVVRARLRWRLSYICSG